MATSEGAVIGKVGLWTVVLFSFLGIVVAFFLEATLIFTICLFINLLCHIAILVEGSNHV